MNYLLQCVRHGPLFAIALAMSCPVEAAITGASILTNAGEPILAAAADPTDANQLLLAGRGGDILRLDLAGETIASEPFLSIPGVTTAGEGGLLGLALHPEYATNGLGYAYYTTAGGAFNAGVSNIASFQRDPSDPTRALPGSLTTLLSFDQPQNNHNGGWIGFSPHDEYLYIASGDGGGGNDSGTGHTNGIGNAQDLTDNLLGKMLRIDVNGDDFPADASRNYAIPADNPFVGESGDDEIWAYGLRNPFRNSFDRQTGDLWIADVGQGEREEINFQPADSTGGENYGWRLREGFIETPGVGGPKPADAVDPVYDYRRLGTNFSPFELQGNSVTGGYVYRGPDPSLEGLYFFGDFVAGHYWTFDPSDPFGTVDQVNSELFGSGPSASSPISFAEDGSGNLYILTINGDIWQIETSPPPGDYNGDGVVDELDYDAWTAAYGSTDQAADGNADGMVDAADYTVWRDALADQGTSGAVPEPSAISISLLAWAIASSIRRLPVNA